MSGETVEVASAAELVAYLDNLAASLGRPPRVYVIGHKERTHAEIERLIAASDVCVEKQSWSLLDDPSRYEWVNP